MFDRNLLNLPGGRRMLALLVAFGLADALLIMAQALALAQAIVAVWQVAPFAGAGVFAVILHGSLLPQADALVGALLCALGFFAAFLLRRGLGVWRDAIMDRFARKVCAELRADLLESAWELGPRDVARRGTGASATLLVGGIDAVHTYVALLFPKVADLMVVPTVLTVGLFVLDWISGIIALVLLPCIILFMQMLGTHAKAQAERQHAEFTRLSNHFMDTLRGLPTLQVFGRSRAYAKQVFSVSERSREATITTLRTAFLSSLVLDLFRTFGLAAVAIMFGFRLMDGAVALLPALAVLIILPEYFAAIRRYATDFHASLDGRTNLSAILEVLDAARTSRNRRAQLGTPALPKLGDDTVFSTVDLGFSYDGAQDSADGASALTDVSFTVNGPLKVGIIGPSGAGKTTLVQLLAGFADPTQGHFTVGGVEARTLHLPDWQRQVIYIPQQPAILSASLRDNVAFYVPDAPEEAIRRAVDLAGLDDLVATLPQGLDTPIGAGGRALSGGQAQRVALARAFLDESRRVLIFDEPTAHLDIETELALKSRMLPAMEGRLVFFATHRLHWVKDMDLVLRLEAGRPVSVERPGNCSEEVRHA